MDSVMLGSLTFYRRLLHENFFSRPPPLSLYCSGTYSDQRLSTLVRFSLSVFPSRLYIGYETGRGSNLLKGRV